MIRFLCQCGCEMIVGESWAGLEILCPDCDDLVEVPCLGPDQPDHSRRRCPDCDSPDIERITSRRKLKKQLPEGDPLAGDDSELNQAFVFQLPRNCKQCGAIWLPPLPRWLGPVLIIGGVLLFAFFLGLPIYLYFFVPAQRENDYVYVSGGIVIGSLAVIAYGWHLTCGGSCRPRILRAGYVDEDDDSAEG